MANLIFMGTPSFAVPTLAALLEKGYSVEAVFTQPDRPSGRGRNVRPPPVKVWAKEHGLPVIQPETASDEVAVNQLRRLAPTVLVVAAYGKLLPKMVLDIPSKGSLNLHPSLLPRHRGPSPIAAAILAGEEATGSTVMLLDEGLDTGPMLGYREESIRPEDTAGSLERRLAQSGADLMVDTLGLWLEGKIVPVPQDNGRASTTKFITKAHGEIDWEEPAEILSRKIRAFHPWPGAYTKWRGESLHIKEGQALIGAGGEPGLVQGAFVQTNMGIGIGTGDGTLVVTRLQKAGRKTVTADEFIAGHEGFVGTRLPS